MSFGLLKQGSLRAKKMFGVSAQEETLTSNIRLIYQTFHRFVRLPFLFNTIHDSTIIILVLVGGVPLFSNTILLPSYVLEILLVFLLILHTTMVIISCCGSFIDYLMVSSFDQEVSSINQVVSTLYRQVTSRDCGLLHYITR